MPTRLQSDEPDGRRVVGVPRGGGSVIFLRDGQMGGTARPGPGTARHGTVRARPV
jgi:hypothetical protein